VIGEGGLVQELVPLLHDVLGGAGRESAEDEEPDLNGVLQEGRFEADRESPMTILIADDNEHDCRLASEAVRRAHLRNRVRFVRDGVELLDYLYHRGSFSKPWEAPRPGLILLDLNMPRLDGRQALEEIRADPDLATIPVVVLTASRADEDYWRAQRLAANEYLIKPVTVDALVHVVRSLGEYGIEIVGPTQKSERVSAARATGT
jgi:CheY-like chemotaxis protein